MCANFMCSVLKWIFAIVVSLFIASLYLCVLHDYVSNFGVINSDNFKSNADLISNEFFFS